MAIREDSFFNDDVRPSFEQEWPELAWRLERFLAAKGVDRWLRSDVIQETATRIYPRWETLDHSEPLWNLVATIALRAVHNHRRKESRIELVPDPDPPHQDDVPQRGLQRAQLDKTRAALRHLTTDQRRVLLAEVGEAVLPDGTRNRTNVLRLRARAKLREMLGPWAPSGVVIRLRSLRDRVMQKGVGFEMPISAMANSLVTLATVASLSLAGAGSPAGPGDAARPERTPVLSLKELRDIVRDPTRGIPRLDTSNPTDLASVKGRARKVDEEASGFVANLDKTAAGLGEWAGRRRGEVGDRQEEVGARQEEVGDRQEEVEREARRQVGNRQEEAKARHEEVRDRQEEVEDLVP